jgi:hypothetical protein
MSISFPQFGLFSAIIFMEYAFCAFSLHLFYFGVVGVLFNFVDNSFFLL